MFTCVFTSWLIGENGPPTLIVYLAVLVVGLALIAEWSPRAVIRFPLFVSFIVLASWPVLTGAVIFLGLALVVLRVVTASLLDEVKVEYQAFIEDGRELLKRPRKNPSATDTIDRGLSRPE